MGWLIKYKGVYSTFKFTYIKFLTVQKFLYKFKKLFPIKL